MEFPSIFPPKNKSVHWTDVILITISLLVFSFSLSAQNITKPNIQGPMPGLQVNAYNGNLFSQRTDLFIPAQGLDIDITFSYNSNQTLIDYGFGFGWTFTCNIAYELDGTDVVIRREDGRKDIFTFNGTDYDAPTGFFDILTEYLPGKYSLRAKNGLTCFFDDPVSKRVTRMEDRYGNTLTMTYNGQEISTLTHSSGQLIQFTWTGGRMTKVTDPNFSPPREILYQYNGNGLPVQVTDAIGNSTQYVYDNERKITHVIDKRGTSCNITYNANRAVSGITSPLTNQTITYDPPNLEVELIEQVGAGTRVTTYTYDANGNVIQTQNPCCSSGLNLLYEYDADRNMTKFTDGNGNEYNYTYDNNGNRLSEIDPLGQTRSWTYEPVFNNVTSSTDKNGNLTTYIYDANGNIIQSNLPESITESYTYDSFGNRISYTDGNGNVTTYAYDANGYLLTVNYPIGTESYTYDGVGNQISDTDANGNLTTYTYDARDRLITTTDALGFVTTYTYDPNDNEIAMTDALGNTTTYAYDVLNRLTINTRPIGVTSFTYDELDNMTSTTDPNGNLTLFEYNVQNLVTKTINAVGDDMTYTYDPNGNQTSMTDFRGNTTTYTYDALDRRILEVAPLGQTFQYGYDPNSNLTFFIDANGNTTSYTYDGINRQIAITDPVGTTLFTYDKNSNITAETDANGNTTSFAYDGNDRLVSTTDAMGFVTTTIYDDYGNMLSLTDPNLNSTTFSYDARNLLTTSTNAENETSSFTYDGVQNTNTEIWPNGNTLSYSYDANYRLTGITDLMGTVVNNTYDDNANLLSETDGNGNTVSYTYDVLDRLVSSTDALGESLFYSYDPNSNLLQSTDRNGNATQYEYDALDRRTRSVDALGNEILSTYDPQNNLTSLTDDNGNTTAYAYDALNRMVRETFADATTKEYTYDPEDNLLSRKDNNGDFTNYSYDDRYLLTKRDYPHTNDDNFTYDPGRRMLSAQNNHANILYTYDKANRILSETSSGATTGYAYDIPNRKRTVTYPGGRQVVEQRDLRERFSSVSEGSITIASYTYDSGDRMVSTTRHNGVTSGYTYNNNDWVTELNHTKGATLIAGFTYDFDKEGNKLFEEKVHHPNHSEQYSYDNIYRVTDFKEGILTAGNIPAPIQNDQFDYDGMGNRTATIEDGVTRNYTANSMNEYLAIANGGTINPVHDDNGNLLFDGTHNNYAYDTENRLINVDGIAEYQYDPFSRRIKKILPDATIEFYYDGWRVIEERANTDPCANGNVPCGKNKVLVCHIPPGNPNNPQTICINESALAAHLAHGDYCGPCQDNGVNTITTYVFGDWIDEVLTMDRDGETYFYHQNSLGSVIAMTDENGNVVERYEYETYGKVNVFDNAYNVLTSSAIGNPYLFTGRRLDEETGLYYYRARYYDSVNGRFMQRDPIGIWEDEVNQGNGYAYVGNNSTNWMDPTGQKVVKLSFYIKQVQDVLKKLELPYKWLDCLQKVKAHIRISVTASTKGNPTPKWREGSLFSKSSLFLPMDYFYPMWIKASWLSRRKFEKRMKLKPVRILTIDQFGDLVHELFHAWYEHCKPKEWKLSAKGGQASQEHLVGEDYITHLVKQRYHVYRVFKKGRKKQARKQWTNALGKTGLNKSVLRAVQQLKDIKQYSNIEKYLERSDRYGFEKTPSWLANSNTGCRTNKK